MSHEHISESLPATPDPASTASSVGSPTALRGGAEADGSDATARAAAADALSAKDEDETAGLSLGDDGKPIDGAAADAAEVVDSFLTSYAARDRAQTDEQWLASQFRKYPDLWGSDAELESAAREVAAAIDGANTSKASLNQAMAAGQSGANWFVSELDRIAAAKGIVNVGAYAGTIDNALEQAIRNGAKVIQRADGAISGCTNLDGFIAEQHHVDSFNIDAAAKGSAYRAKVLTPEPGQPYRKNSVDIVIRDADGKIVRRYQSKYGADADATSNLFKQGDYRGQRKLVPEGQGDGVSGSAETIEMDGVSSTPMSKTQAKQQQQDAQQNGEAKRYDWENVDHGAVARKILKGALLAAVISVGFQAARILGRRAWNTLRGKRNPTFSEDLHEFLSSSLVSATNAGIHTAFAGAMVVAVKRGLLGSLLKETPAGRIASATFIALENVKVLWKLGRGEITTDEALDAIGETTTVAVVSMAAMAEGAAIGASIGSVLGPIGLAIGGFTGGLVAGMAGGVAGKTIYDGAKALGAKVVAVTSTAVNAAKESTSRMVDSVLSFLGA